MIAKGRRESVITTELNVNKPMQELKMSKSRMNQIIIQEALHETDSRHPNLQLPNLW